MRIKIKQGVPKTHRYIKRFLVMPLRVDYNTVVWLETITVEQRRENEYAQWYDVDYQLKHRNAR